MRLTAADYCKYRFFDRLSLGTQMRAEALIFLQFFWIVYTLYGVTFANSAINVVFELVALFLSLQIANKEMRTSYKMSWIFLILFLYKGHKWLSVNDRTSLLTF